MTEASIHADKAGIDRWVIPALIGFMPAVILALTWDKGGVYAFVPRMLREYAIPIVAAEGIVIGLAMMHGLAGWLRRAAPPRLILLCLGLWLAIAFGTAMFAAVYPPFAIFLTLLWVVHILFGLSMAHLARERVFDEGRLLAFMLAGFCVYAIGFALFPFQVDDPARFNWLFRMPGLGHLRRSGYYATGILGLCAGVLAVRRSNLALPVFACAVGWFLVVWSGSRAPVPAVIASTALCWLLFPAMRSGRALLLLLLAAAVGVAVALAFPMPGGEFTGAARLVTQQTTSGRTEFWPVMLQRVLDHPWFGHGEGQTAFVLRRNFVANAHNLLIQLLFAWGIVGTLCVAVLGAWIARFVILAARREGGMMLPFVSGATALLAQSPVDGTLYDVASLALFAACIGTAAGIALRQGEASADPAARVAAALAREDLAA